jgi:hypothetical protein
MPALERTATVTTVSVLAAALLSTGCGNGHDDGAAGMTVPAQATPVFAIGWNHLRKGMNPREVLDLIDEPMKVKVSTVSTRWWYSAYGDRGPRVIFDTETMKVERWYAPRVDE